MKIKSELGRFLFQNMFAHDPCHDFSPIGGGKRMHKLNSRFDQVSKMFQPRAGGGGDGNSQSGGKMEDLNPTADIDLAGDYVGINGGEVVGTYSGFEEDGAINTVTNLLNEDFRAALISKYADDDDKDRIRSVLPAMTSSIKAIAPKYDDKKPLLVSSNTAVNNSDGLDFLIGVVTRSAENLRRVYINQMQEVIEMNDYIRLTIVMHNANDAGATTGVESPHNFEPIFGGRVENLPTGVVPPLPPAIYSSNNTGKEAFLPHLSRKMPTIKFIKAPKSEPVERRERAGPIAGGLCRVEAATLTMVAHPLDILAAGHVRLARHQATVRVLAHAKGIGQLDPLDGVDVHAQIPPVDLAGVHPEQEGV